MSTITEHIEAIRLFRADLKAPPKGMSERFAHRDELGLIVQTWLAYLDQSGVDVEAERHPDNPSLNPVKALCERSRAALARQS